MNRCSCVSKMHSRNDLILDENDSSIKAMNAKTGETCQEYWQKTMSSKFSSVVSKYNSEQPEKPGMVKCTCCSSHVQGKTIKWFNDTEAAPEWEQCERCQKWLSHMEQDSKVELLNMCTDCFAEKQGSEKSLDFSSKSRRQTN